MGGAEAWLMGRGVGGRGCVPECRKRIKRKIKQKALTKRSRKTRKCNVKINLPEAQNVLPVSAALLCSLLSRCPRASVRYSCVRSPLQIYYMCRQSREIEEEGECGFPILYSHSAQRNNKYEFSIRSISYFSNIFLSFSSIFFIPPSPHETCDIFLICRFRFLFMFSREY